jgi:ankyrin repeat protein
MDGKFALLVAAHEGRADLCQLLIEAGASVTATDREGFSALHVACVDLLGEGRGPSWVTEHEEVVKLLLSYGAHVNGLDSGGFSPLMYCAQQRHNDRVDDIGIAELLLEYGASLSACSQGPSDGGLAGMTAYDIAIKLGAHKVAELLRSAAAAEGAAATQSQTQSDKINAFLTFCDEKLVPANKKGVARLCAAGIKPGSSLIGTPQHLRTEEQERASIAGETLLAEAILEHAGICRDDM